MGGAIWTDADAAMRARNHHVEIAIADRGANLVEIARRGKGRIGAKTGSFLLLPIRLRQMWPIVRRCPC